MIPLYPYSGFDFYSSIDTKLVFLDSARSALFLIAKTLSDSIFLIPSYTCPTVWNALEQAGVKYDFVDLDDELDFDLHDLSFMMKKYENSKIVLVPTSLFGAKIRDYKKLYPKLMIVEDRAQGIVDLSYNPDFQIISFGKGKMISGFYGGAIYDKYHILEHNIKLLNINREFFKSYFLSIVQKIVSRIWFVIENTKYDPEESVKLHIEKITPSLLSKVKTKWILNTINNTDYSHRIKISNFYLEHIKKEYLYNIKSNTPYLRMPIKKNISFSGVSKIRDFHETFFNANRKKNKDQIGARQLVEGVYLPTHNLVTIAYAKKIVELINE